MRYLPTIIGSHAPPTVLASQLGDATAGRASMNGGTIEMRNSGIESASENENMNALVRVRLGLRLGLHVDGVRRRPGSARP